MSLIMVNTSVQFFKWVLFPQREISQNEFCVSMCVKFFDSSRIKTHGSGKLM